jgi:hypothetical protein
MLPNLGLITATVGLLAILYIIDREARHELSPAERGSLAAGALIVVGVAAIHLFVTSGGGGH